MAGRREVLLGATVATLVLVAAVAAASPVPVWHSVGFSTRPRPPAGLRMGHGRQGHQPQGSWSMPSWLTAFIIVLLLLFALSLAALLAYGSYGWLRSRKASRLQLSEPDPDAFDVPDLPEQLTRTTADQLSALYHGAPRNAIIECWLALETAAADVGIPRRPTETSAEFTGRVLSQYVVDSTAIGNLAALYREARFSEHELTETHRRAAIGALEALDTGLRRRQAVAAAGRVGGG